MTEEAPKAASEDHIDLVIRDETLDRERRTILTPHQVAELTREGFKVALVCWPERCFTDEQYTRAVEQRGNPQNFILMDHDQWREDPNCAKSIILGVKEIPRKPPGSVDFILNHTYVHFDHSYKGQFGSAERLARFAFGYLFEEEGASNSILLDHEYCTDEDGKRTHAFGHSAGYATAAMSVLCWAQKINGIPVGLATTSYNSKDEFFSLHTQEIEQAIKTNGAPPAAVILGSPRGRSANGAMDFLKDVNRHLNASDQISAEFWGREETAARQTDDKGLQGLENYDLVFNCTYTDRPCRPFANDETAQKRGSRLQVFGDVTCDATPDKNRLRFSNYRITDFDAPLLEVGPNTCAITVDHSPSLFPLEATLDIARQAYPHIKSLLHAKRSDLGLPLDSPWAHALEAFEDNMQVPLYAYDLGASLVRDDDIYLSDMSEHQRDAYLESVRLEIERNIKLSLGELHQLRPREERAFFYHVAMGMLRVHEFVEIAANNGHQGQAYDGPDMTNKIEAIEQLLSRKFNISSLASSHEVSQLHALSYAFRASLQDYTVAQALGFTSPEETESRILEDKVPSQFSLFLVYLSEAQQMALAHLYPEDYREEIERDYLTVKATLQTRTSLPPGFFQNIEAIIDTPPPLPEGEINTLSPEPVEDTNFEL